MRSHKLEPGRLAHLISALYESTSGAHAGALHDAAARNGLQVLVSTQHVPQHINRYNITAALLAPTWAKPLTLPNWSTSSPSNSNSTGSSSSSSSSCSAGTSLPTAAAPTLRQRLWSSTQLGTRTVCSTRQSIHSSTISLAADTALNSSSTWSHTGCPTANSRRSSCNSSATSAARESRHQWRQLPVYLLIAGISGGYDQHVQAARQLYSQADFFVCAQPGSFWHRIAKALDHRLEVPGLLQQPLEGFIVPWLKALHEQNMHRLTQRGYAGLEVVLSGHSLGGFLADSAALMLPNSFPQKRIEFSSVTFDSPGVPAAVIEQYGLCVALSDLHTGQGNGRVSQQVQPEPENYKAAPLAMLQQPVMNSSATLGAKELPLEAEATTSNASASVTAGAAAAGAEVSVGLAAAEAARDATSSAAGRNMVSYLASPTPLNTLFKHPGLIYHVMVDSQQGNSSFDVLAYALIDAARCYFLYDTAHYLLALFCNDLVTLNPAATAAAMSDATSGNICSGQGTAASAVTYAAAAVTAAAVSGASSEPTAATVAASFSAAALLVGALGSLGGRLVLGGVDLVEQHSLDGMRLRAFDLQAGDHYAAKVQQMQSWPGFTPGSEMKALGLDLILGLLPSFVWRQNRGVWTLWEGKAARSRRMLKWRSGFVPRKAADVVGPAYGCRDSTVTDNRSDWSSIR